MKTFTLSRIQSYPTSTAMILFMNKVRTFPLIPSCVRIIPPKTRLAKDEKLLIIIEGHFFIFKPLIAQFQIF